MKMKDTNKKETKKEKISVFRILSNYAYLLRYAGKKDALLIYGIFFSFLVGGVGYACMDTVFLRAFINYLSGDAYSFRETAVLIVTATTLMAVLMSITRCAESFTRPRMIRLVGMMQEEMIHKVVDMDLMYYDCDSYYDDFVVTASQLEEMVEMAVYDLGRMGSNVMTVLVLSGLITTINPVIVIFPVLGFLINLFSRFRIIKLEYDYYVKRETLMRRADYSKRVFYQPEYAKEIKLSHIEIPLEKQFHAAIDETIEIGKYYGVRISLWSVVNWVTVFTILSGFCVPLYLGYLALVRRSIGLGEVAALDNAQGTVRNRLDSVNYCVDRIQRAGLFCEKFRIFMDYESKIEHKRGECEIPRQREVLRLRDISFRYDGAKHDTLKHISMEIRPGEKVALVGENGAGKSTLVKLLMRLYDVTDGSIEYGGRDIKAYDTDAYREVFGSVFQDYQVYAASLEENVLMDELEAVPVNAGQETEEIHFNDVDVDAGKNEPETAGQKKVIAALCKGGFFKRLQTLPAGLSTPLTREFMENGVNLSGGETQKVAISRVFAKNPQIAILDEPSSALDPRAEYELNHNIMKHLSDTSVIFISHRLSTTKDADRIYMFEKGEIVEDGTHEELMALNGKYAEMFELQAKYYKENEEILLL